MTVNSIENSNNTNTTNSRQAFLPQALAIRAPTTRLSKRGKTKGNTEDLPLTVEQVKAYMANMRIGCKSQMT